MLRIFSVIISLIVSTACFADSEIKVGVILDLTGPAASAGVAVKNGILLAHESLPRTERDRIRLIFENDEFNGAKSVSAFNKLVANDKIDVAIGLGSGPGNAVSPIADKKKIPYIAIASDPAIVKGRSHVVNHWVTPEMEVKVMLEEIKKRGYKRIARITGIHQFPIAVNEVLDREKPGDLAVVIDEEFAPDSKDFRSYIAKLRQIKDVDAVFVNLIFGQVGVFAKELRAMGSNLEMFGVEVFDDPADVKNSNGALVGQWYVNADTGTSDFIKAYKAKYPDAATFGAANGHDAILLIRDAMVKKQDLNTLLHSVSNFKRACGEYSSTGDNRFTLPAVVQIVK